MGDIVVGMTYMHFKGGVYKVVGTHYMQHHFEGVPDGQGLEVVRYVRVMTANGAWENRGEEYLRPLIDWEAPVEWPNGKIMPRFVPIQVALDAGMFDPLMIKFGIQYGKLYCQPCLAEAEDK